MPDASLDSLQGLLKKFDREYAAAPSAKSREAWQRHSDFMRVSALPCWPPFCHFASLPPAPSQASCRA